MELLLQEAESLEMTNGYHGFLQLGFDVQPMTMNNSDAQSLLNVVLQLGQFYNIQRRDGRAQEEEVPQDTEILSAYLHDAVVVATVASQRDIKDFLPRNLSIAAPFKLKTGSLDFDEQGIRKAKFSLVEHQGTGKMVTVAEVTSNQNLTVLNEILWDGGHVPVSEITCSANDSCMGHGCSGQACAMDTRTDGQVGDAGRLDYDKETQTKNYFEEFEKVCLKDLKLKNVKQLSHNNVNQFVGAYVSTEPGNSYVLFRYCSKGSLQDKLANGDIKLDWMFKPSFALDLAKV
ncbi:guanylate cyclase [Plakobranchus ocellatus]|uniref:Guanylate cyclase n=1 Tax=Plakobranchus ocellatus TaxID=259542 RepID=A0AAV4BUT3_9GAST|nr:guanylate cyclase [Plakobranchus ocellatus]